MLVAAPGREPSGASAATRAGIEYAGEIGAADDAEGLVFHGTDHELALIAGRTTVPVLLDPPERSDLLRMFGPLPPLRARLERGSPYPADLGVARRGGVAHPFVAHAVYSRSGRLPGTLAGRRTLTVWRDDRSRETSAAAVVACNAQHVEGERLSPRSALMDAALDVHVFEGGVRTRARSRRRRRLGLQRRADAIRRRTASVLRMSEVPRWTLSTDGKPLGGGQWELSVEAAGYTLWV